MNLGNHLFQARKRRGLSQEAAAETLGVSRQTISKWETDETLPDIRQSKRMAALYKLSLDELIDFDLDVQEVQAAIERTSDAVTDKIDWTNAWGKSTPSWSPTRRRWTQPPTPRSWTGCWTGSRKNTATASWTPCWSSKTFCPRCGRGGERGPDHHARLNCFSICFFVISMATGRPWGQYFTAPDMTIRATSSSS